MEKMLTRFVLSLVFVALGCLAWAQPTISCPGVNAGPNQAVTCANNCANLNAVPVSGFAPTTYNAQQIPYTPYSYTTGTPIIVNIDDRWSNIINLPFNFCFYGNMYNQCVIGSNGVVSFNLGYANGFNQWVIGSGIPGNADVLNSICGPFHDTDPSVGGTIYWQVYGTAPCRVLVVSFNQIPMYDCNNLIARQQTVIYETTNIIETYIANKPTCSSWNGGYAIHGIQNAAGTAATVVPGRNFPSVWSTSNNAWRFVPAGPQNYVTQWFQVGNPVAIATGNATTVCPSSTQSYYAQVTYTNCDNSTVIVRDTLQVSIPNGITAINPVVNQINCTSLGNISLTPQGGTPGYTYTWSPSFGNVSSISNLSAGTYSVTVTDAAGCTFPQTFTINPYTPPVASISNSLNISCNGANDGSATATVAGGIPNYSYAWSTIPVQTTATATGLGVGTFTVTVTDGAGCTSTASVTITQPTPLVLTLNYQQNVSCNGAADGCLGVTATGGSGNYSFLWSNGSTNDTICSLPPGNYTVTLTDTTQRNLTTTALCTATISGTISQPSPLTATYNVVDVLCNGDTTGCITANVSGGNGNYHYLWSTGDTLANICGLSAGTYTITVTDTSSVIGQGTGPVVLFNETFDGALTWTLNVPTGVNGLDPNFWVINDNEGGVIPPGCGVATNGNKTLHITSVFFPAGGAAYDAGGLCGILYCPETNMRAESPAFSTLGQNNLTLSYDFISMGDGLLDNASVWYNAGLGWTMLTPSIKSINCLSGQGQWTNNTVALPPACWNVPALQIGFNWTNNDDGIGTDPSVALNDVRVTGPGSLTVGPVLCQRIDTIVVAEPSPVVLGITGYDVSCFGGNDGSAVVTHTGGTPGYTVTWSNSMTGDSISGLTAGTYVATVVDNNGCTDTISVTLTQPAAIVTNTSMTVVSCNGGSDGCAIVTASGGPSGNFIYQWSNGGSNDTICGLAAGTYYVTVTDTTGGSSVQNVTVYNETFDPAPAWTLNVPTGVNGTDPNFWVINDNEGGVIPPGCGVASNGNNSLHITSVFFPGGGAAYDAGGLCGILFCPETNMRAESPVINTTGFSNLTLTFDFISMGDALIDNASVWYNDGLGWTQLSPSIKSVNCLSGQGQWTAASFVLPPNTWNIPNLRIGFNWTNNDDGVGTDPSVAINNVLITSTTTLTGNASCSVVDSITVIEPTPVAIAFTQTNSYCGQPNGTATATGSGGNGGYSYVWNTSPAQATATATGLLPGTYTVTVTDLLGCTAVDSITIQSNPAPVISLPSITNVSCFQGNDGAATATTTLGTAPITISWGTTPVQTGTSVSGLSAGTYWAWATDSAGCVDSIQFTITHPTLLVATVTTVGAICGLPNGSATASGNGGTPPYSYTWSNGQTGPNATGLGGGSYIVTVTDDNGCQRVSNFFIFQAGSPSLTLSGLNMVTCFGGNDGGASVSTSGGVGPYTYAWSTTPTQTTANALNLSAGTYTVTVTDQNGCRDNLTVTITEPSQLAGTVVTTPNGCNLTIPNGTAGVVASGGTPPYSYQWNSVPVQNGSYATGLAPGNYSVTVSDARGCILVLPATVGQIPVPVVTAGPDVTVCEGEGGAIIFATPSSGTPTYYYNWWCANPPCGLDSVFDNDPNANPTASQWYYVQVTDVNGCYSNIDSLFVTVLPKPIVDAGPDIVLCGDAAPCEILTPTITGATGPYTYLWIPNTGLNNATIMNPCARPDTTTIYTLLVTAGNGCTSDYTTTDTLSTVTVFVNPVPVANAGPDRHICFGDSVQMQGTASGAGPVYAFEWTPGDGLSDSLVASPFASPALTTDYTLVVWSNGCPSYGDTARVNVHTLPTVDAGWDREICPGDSILLDAMASGDSTAGYTFHWWPNAGIGGSADVEDPTVGPTQTTTYYVTATSSWGCGSAMDSALVTVKPAPWAEAGPNLTVCPGDSIQLLASYSYTTNDTAPTSQIYFSWTPGATMSDTTELNPWVWPSVSTWYTLDIRYNTCRTEDSVLVTVGPQAFSQVLPDTTVICALDSVLLDASASFGNQFHWIPSAGLSDPNSLTPMASPGTTTTYSLVIGDGFCNDTSEFTLSVLPSPTADYISSSPFGCAPHEMHFTQVSSGSIAYVWDFGDGSPVENLPQPSHIYTTAGSYTVTLTAVAPGGCSDEIQTIQVEVTEFAVAAFSSNPDFPVQMTLPSTTVQFQDESINASTWYWDFGDGMTSTETDPTHTYSAPGEYFVTLMVGNVNGCVGEVTHGPYVVVIPDLFIPNVFSPNGDGINDLFQPQYSGDQPFTCLVFDRWGVKLWETVNKTAGWSGKNANDEDVVEGVYFYIAKVGNREFVGEVTLVR